MHFLLRFLFLSLVLESDANAFIRPLLSTTNRAYRSSSIVSSPWLVIKTRLFAYQPGEEEHDDDDDDHFDVEAVRQRLEALLVGGGLGSAGAASGLPSRDEQPSATSGNNNQNSPIRRPIKTSSVSHNHEPVLFLSPPAGVTLPEPPLMTTIDRERRLAEINLLARLSDDDTAVADLWQHWFHERGPEAAARLEQAEDLVTKQEYGAAEALLRQLIDEYGVYWAEPLNRLATLFYLQGKLEASEALCKVVLSVKPWHFGALSGIVVVYAAMHDADQAQQWAPRRLPTLSQQTAAQVAPNNRRRRAWVAQALASAKRALDAAEERLFLAFGKPDDHVALERGVQGQDDDDSWQ